MPKQKSAQVAERIVEIADIPLVVLAVVWLFLFLVPLIMRLGPSELVGIDAASYVIWALFAAEYIVRLVLAERKLAYIAHHKLDLVVVIVPILRPLRLVRLLDILGTARVFSTAAISLKRVKGILGHHHLHYVLFSMGVIFLSCSGLEFLAETHSKGATIHSFGDAVWWAFETVSTVGYGDKVPVTLFGRGIAVVLMFTGITLMGTLAAMISSYFIESEIGEQGKRNSDTVDERLSRIEAEIARIANSLEKK